MSSLARGNSTSAIEVTNISAHGFWILVDDKELFLSYEDFPWFRDQTVKAILKVERPSNGHFYWPDLDVDLTVEIIEHPERFGLSQLHQLRGRVGRGKKRGLCLLMASKELKKESLARLKILAENHDGFLIAQKDLESMGA